MPGVARGRGFTLVELLVALVVWAVVGSGAVGVLVAGQRAYWRNRQLARTHDTIRGATTILAGELRGAEVLGGTRTSLTYRVSRTLHVACDRPDPTRSSILLRASFLGSRPLDPDVDSVLLFADGDPATEKDDRWLHADLREISPGASCPDGTAAVSARVSGVPSSSLEAVGAGAPVRGAAVWELKAYPDGQGVWWVGMRRYQKRRGGWPVFQPVLGPVAPGGLVFRYFAADGRPTDDAPRAFSVGLALAVEPGPAGAPHAALTGERRLDLRVALRNAFQP